MPAPLSNHNTPDPNYQAMLTTEPLDTANIVDIPANLSTPFDYLTNSDTDADKADLCSARRWAWYCKDPACPKYWSGWSCKSNFWLHLYETAVHRADVRTHTGKTARAGKGVESRDGLGDERNEAAQACSGTEWYCVGQRMDRGGVEFSDGICFRLVREIVTFGDSGVNS